VAQRVLDSNHKFLKTVDIPSSSGEHEYGYWDLAE